MRMRIALVGSPTRTNLELAHAWRALGVDALVLSPDEALAQVRAGDVAIGRLDVLPSLDGVEPGLELLDELAGRGARVLNPTEALLGAHDKLRTAHLLEDAGIPHPRTMHVAPPRAVPAVPLPCVLKPRFGSWGEDVVLCRSLEDVGDALAWMSQRSWWARHGVLVQEVVPRVRRDLRLVVAGGRVVAAAERVPAEGEWRTNVSLGGHVEPARPPGRAVELAIAAARAVGIDLTGVDLLPVDGGWTVLELNGAVDFDERYALEDVDRFRAILDALGIEVEGRDALDMERMVRTMTRRFEGGMPTVGDEIAITGHAVGDAPRTAVVLEVLGEPGHERFRVRWEDGHESIYFPGGDATVHRATRRRAKAHG
jgi:RimK family alpha-L-glutamate ligase